MTVLSFVDTNTLIYAYDKRYLDKQRIASQLIRHLKANQELVLSTQVCKEFYNIATRKLGLELLVVKAVINSYRNSIIVTTDMDLVEKGIDISINYKTSFLERYDCCCGMSSELPYTLF